MTSWLADALSDPGRVAEFPQTKPSEPESGPRTTWLKTRAVKKELESTAKRKVFNDLLANSDKPATMGLTEDEIFGLFDITARPRRGD